MKLIFVFGSNEGGRHGAGAAKRALEEFGAVYGKGIGRTGDAYGIPTKDRLIHKLPLASVAHYTEDFKRYAANSTADLAYQITNIGCGLARFLPEEIAPLFSGTTDNCWFDTIWQPLLGGQSRFWGTYDEKTNQDVYLDDFKALLDSLKAPQP